jgi:hypothetical protein
MHRALFCGTFLTFRKLYILSVVVYIKFLHTTVSQLFSKIPKRYLCSSIFVGRMNVTLPSCVMLLCERGSFYLRIQLWFAAMRTIKAVCMYMGLLLCIPPAAADLGGLYSLYYNTYLVKMRFAHLLKTPRLCLLRPMITSYFHIDVILPSCIASLHMLDSCSTVCTQSRGISIILSCFHLHMRHIT